MSQNATRALECEMSDKQALIEQIKALSEDDPTLAADMIEGETNILELIALVDASEFEDAIHVEALDAALKRLKARKDRIEDRIDMKRAVLANALDMISKKSHETALGTITIKPKPMTAIVTNEADIPARFWKAQAPVLDKAGLNAAVKAGEDIPGATKSNAGFSLAIRR